jgi:hypothetical protein
MAATILSSSLIQDLILPFLLVFAVSYAILQKSEILGKEKRQTDAIVALVLGLIVVAVGSVTHIITGLIPILAVGLVVLLAFFLLWGFAFKPGEFKVPGGVQWTIAAIAAIVITVALLYLTGGMDYIKSAIGGTGSIWLTNIVLIVIVIVAVVVVIGFGSGSSSGSSSGSH